MSRKSTSRFNHLRSTRMKLNPTTRAIRSAILGLAVLGAAPAMAGTCTYVTPNLLECDGIFSPGFPPQNVSSAVDDLTVVVGGNSATTILPGSGVSGIDLDSLNGYVNLYSDAIIVTDAADAISVYAAEGIDIYQSGVVTAIDGDGINAYSYLYDVTIVNAGAVAATAANVDDQVVVGIYGYAAGGVTSVTQYVSGQVEATSANGTSAVAAGIVALGVYGAAIDVQGGSVDAETQEGEAFGVYAGSLFGVSDLTIADGAEITATVGTDVGSDAIGAMVESFYGTASLDNAGDITAITYGQNGAATGAHVSAFYDVQASNTGNKIGRAHV